MQNNRQTGRNQRVPSASNETETNLHEVQHYRRELALPLLLVHSPGLRAACPCTGVWAVVGAPGGAGQGLSEAQADLHPL